MESLQSRKFLRGWRHTGCDGETSRMTAHDNSVKRFVAYFSMEIALENAMPSYSGGLGVLAGDTIRAAADLRLPMVAVSLLYRKGFFSQHLAEDGTQTEEPVEWRVSGRAPVKKEQGRSVFGQFRLRVASSSAGLWCCA